MKKITKTIFASLMVLSIGTTLVGCTEADRVSENVSQEADNFNVVRRLTVLDTRNHKPLFELIGAFSIKVDKADMQLEVTAETGPGQYKKHFVGYNRDTMYVIEDISGANVSKYQYEVNFLPEMIVPIKLKSKD